MSGESPSLSWIADDFGRPRYGPNRVFWTSERWEWLLGSSEERPLRWTLEPETASRVFTMKSGMPRPPPTSIGIWRLYYPPEQIRYYTTSSSVLDRLVAAGWISEGLLGFVDTRHRIHETKSETVRDYPMPEGMYPGDPIVSTNTSVLDYEIEGYVALWVAQADYSAWQPGTELNMYPIVTDFVAVPIGVTPASNQSFPYRLLGYVPSSEQPNTRRLRMLTSPHSVEKDEFDDHYRHGSFDLPLPVKIFGGVFLGFIPLIIGSSLGGHDKETTVRLPGTVGESDNPGDITPGVSVPPEGG